MGKREGKYMYIYLLGVDGRIIMMFFKQFYQKSNKAGEHPK